MKFVAQLTLFTFGLTAPMLAPLSASADDNGGSSPYEQRYGTSSYIPAYSLDSRTSTISAPSAASTATTQPTSNQDYMVGTPLNAYEQRFDVAPTQSSSQSTIKRAELDLSTIYDSDPSSDVNGGSSYGIETKAYSATIDEKWRLFAGEFFSHELEPFGAGQINYSRSTAGVEYSYNSLIATLAPTYNNYNGNERVGLAGDTTWTINDNWALGGGAELFSRDTPLRALNAGITANAYNLIGDYYQEGIRDVRLTGDAMTFSDDNIRTALGASDIEHLYVSRHFTFDGLATAVESTNSENELRPYFNPRQDVLGMVGGQVGQPLYKGYGITYDHSLQVKPGVYWQENYGSSGAVTAGYTQHVNYKDDFDGSLGVVFTRQDADGTAENDVAIMLNASEKF